MNSQIAITLLKDLEQSLDDYCELNDEGKTAFSMAITALELFGISEQLPSVQPELSNNSKELENKNGELISRQDAIDAIVNTVSEVGNHDNSEVARYGVTFRQHEILDIIESLPSVQPRKGKWLRSGSDIFPYECDTCGDTNERSTSWCPHCGCRMERGDSE